MSGGFIVDSKEKVLSQYESWFDILSINQAELDKVCSAVFTSDVQNIPALLFYTCTQVLCLHGDNTILAMHKRNFYQNISS